MLGRRAQSIEVRYTHNMIIQYTLSMIARKHKQILLLYLI